MATTYSIKDLALPADVCRQIEHSVKSYAKAGIDISITDLDSPQIVVKQARLLNGYILNNHQLYERGKAAFAPAGLKNLKVVPAVFSLDVDSVNLEWINAKMEEFGIKRNDLLRQLALDKSSLSLIFSGERGLTKLTKAAFFYYFLTYELNRDFRESVLV